MYNKRTWLNPLESSSTSNIVCFDGDVEYPDKMYTDTFIKISDCKNSIKLHKKDNEPYSVFIEKIRLLSEELNQFIIYLENNNKI